MFFKRKAAESQFSMRAWWWLACMWQNFRSLSPSVTCLPACGSAAVRHGCHRQGICRASQPSSLLATTFSAGTAVGGLIGGFVGDAAAKRWPNHGRLAVTQVSACVLC